MFHNISVHSRQAPDKFKFNIINSQDSYSEFLQNPTKENCFPVQPDEAWEYNEDLSLLLAHRS